MLLNEQHRAETRGKERERRWTEQHDVVNAQHGARDERHGAGNEQQRKRDTCIAQTQRATAVEQECGRKDLLRFEGSCGVAPKQAEEAGCRRGRAQSEPHGDATTTTPVEKLH